MLLNEATPLSRRPATKRAKDSFALPWLIGLAVVVPLPLLLPIPGSPVFLAGFMGALGALILLARHWLIVLLPVLAALGPYFLPIQAMGVNVFGFRLLIMVLAVFSTPLTMRGEWWFNPVARLSVMFLAFWVSWGLVSLFWTPDVDGGVGDVLTLVFASGLLLALLGLNAHKAEHLDKLRIGWMLALTATAASAFLEIVTGYGLPSAYLGEIVVSDVALGPRGADPAIRSTLGFSGNFGAFLLLPVPFVLWSMERAKGLGKLIYLGALLGVGVLILYSASRLSLIGFMVQLLVYGLVLQRRWYMPFVVLAGALVAVMVVTSIVADSNLLVAQKVSSVAERGADHSMRHRMALTVNGLWMAYKTAGRGVGVAGFEKEIAGDVPVQLPIRYLQEWNAHNHWIEVLSEYGVPVFAAYMALIGWIGLLGWRAQRRGSGLARDPAIIGRAIIVGLVGYLFCGAVTGSILNLPVHWMFLVSLVMMAACLHEWRTAAGRPAARAAMPMPLKDDGRRTRASAVSGIAVQPPR